MSIISYLFMCIIFGTTFLFIKVGLNLGWSPFLFSSLRFIIAGLFVLIFLIAIDKKHNLSWKQHLKVFYLAALMTSFPFAALYWGEQFITSGESAILVASAPLFIILMSTFMHKKRLLKTELCGLISCVAGIFFVIGKEIDIVNNPYNLQAKIFIILAEVGFAYGSIKSKEIMDTIKNPLYVNGLQMFYGGLLLLVFGFLVNESYSFPVHINGFLILLYLIVFASIISYGIYYWLIQRTNPYFPSTWTFISPVIALMLGFSFLNEDISILGYFGSFLIIFGVFLSNVHLFYKRQISSQISA
jgi:drug/metabolite transporter (DMT)-like permease